MQGAIDRDGGTGARRRAWARAGVLAAGLVFLAGCAEVQFISQAAKELDGTPARGPADPDAAGNGKYYKIGNAYQVKGVWYYPREEFDYVEEGIASWYGPNFHGKPTANGAVFDQWKVSAAHRTLPMPSIVRVTNLENGRSLKVKVNDRGPFAHNRIIDLSRRAAQLLGFERQGTALVRVELLEGESRRLAAYMQGRGPRPTIVALGAEAAGATAEEPPPPEAAPSPDVDSENLAPPPGVRVASIPSDAFEVEVRGRPATPEDVERAQSVDGPVGEESLTIEAVPARPTIYIQAGAFAEHVNAVKAQALLRSIAQVEIEQINRSDTPLFRVRLGPIHEVARADGLLTSVQQAGFSDAHIVVAD